jgi:hypothetical protein
MITFLFTFEDHALDYEANKNEEPSPFEEQEPIHEFIEDQRHEKEAPTSLPVEDQTYEESLHEEDIVEEESIHSSTQEDKGMVSCNPFQISEFYDTPYCDLEKEICKYTSKITNNKHQTIHHNIEHKK